MCSAWAVNSSWALTPACVVTTFTAVPTLTTAIQACLPWVYSIGWIAPCASTLTTPPWTTTTVWASTPTIRHAPPAYRGRTVKPQAVCPWVSVTTSKKLTLTTLCDLEPPKATLGVFCWCGRSRRKEQKMNFAHCRHLHTTVTNGPYSSVQG